MRKFFELFIKNTRFWKWFTKPRSKMTSIFLILGSVPLIIVHMPYVGLIVNLIGIAMGAAGVLNLKEKREA